MYVHWRMQVFKIKGFVCKHFLSSPPPSPVSSIWLLFISHMARESGSSGLYCSKQKHLLHRLHRRLGVDFSFRWSMFDSWPGYFFSFNFVLYFFNHIFLMYWLVSLHSCCCPFNNNFMRCFMVTCTLACIHNLTRDLRFVPAT